MENVNLRDIVKPFSREDRQKSNLYFTSTLALWLTTILLTFYFIDSFYGIITSIFLGLLNIRMFVIYHDYMHGAILKGNFLCNYYFSIFGIYMLSPKGIWKRSHNYHHAKNTLLNHASYGSYRILTYEEFNKLNASMKRRYLFERKLSTSILGHFFMFLINFTIIPLFSRKEKHYDSLISLILYFLVFTLLTIYNNFNLWLIIYFTPLFISHCIGTILFYIQHNFDSVELMTKEEWTLDKGAMKSTSYLRMNFIFRWITANIGYHHIHHLNSSIPFYKLPQAHNELLKYAQPKEVNFNLKNIIQSYKLKVYDLNSNCMVPLK